MAKEVEEFSNALSSAVETADAAVVRVRSGHRHRTSGTVWSEDGLIVTAYHALSGDEEVALRFSDGTERPGTIIGADPGTDIALIRAEGGTFGKPTYRDLDGVKVGTPVLALGRPGKTIRASLRIVGALGGEAQTPSGGRLERWVETDRGIPDGFDGGPLVDLQGRIIGIDTAGLVQRADLAIPFVTLQRVVPELAEHGRVRRGWLGIAVQGVHVPQRLHESTGATQGTLVLGVAEGSPADSAGLLLGDVLLELDGKPVRGARDLATILRNRIDVVLSARILRGGNVQDIPLKTGERNERSRPE